ncbi:MAG: NfeD family protein [candidate division Zixibacteria bacterium]|nr:NfeD family protein [candidate division Zixibacteria bacterium]
METLFWIWMAAGLIFLIIEVAVPGLIFVCFAVGSVGAALLAQFYPEQTLYQIGIFGVITILLIPVTRRIARKISAGGGLLSNVDALVGKSAIVVKEIDPIEAKGQVRVQGEIWSASAEGKFALGSEVVIQSVDGNKLVVSAKQESEEFEVSE